MTETREMPMADENATSPGSPSLELVKEPARSPRRSVAVLFVHGINVGAWVWEEHFLPYFAAAGFDAHALSFRGHGRSEGRDRIRDWRLQDYVRDLAAVVDRIGTPVVLIGHSLGGAVVQRFIRCGGRADGMALLASVPPWGLGLSALRLAATSPVLANSIVSMSLGGGANPDIETLRDASFSANAPSPTLDRFAARVTPESPWAMLDVQGWPPLAPPPWAAPPAFVLGGSGDRLIPSDEVWRTGLYYGCGSTIIPLMAHNVMLEPRWETVAAKLRDWLLDRFN